MLSSGDIEDVEASVAVECQRVQVVLWNDEFASPAEHIVGRPQRKVVGHSRRQLESLRFWQAPIIFARHNLPSRLVLVHVDLQISGSNQNEMFVRRAAVLEHLISDELLLCDRIDATWTSVWVEEPHASRSFFWWGWSILWCLRWTSSLQWD